MTQRDTETTRGMEIVCRLNVLPDGNGLVEVMLSPWGKVTSKAGDFVVDEESARLIQENFRKEGRDLPIDFEHTTMGGTYATPSGAAPAAGWITALVPKIGVGLFGLVRWNDAARSMIRADEYRYLSPVMIVRKSDMKAVGLHSAALTNKPAIEAMERVAAKDMSDLAAGQRTVLKGNVMTELLLIGSPLGLAEADCTVEIINNKIGELQKKAETPPETAKAVLVANAARKALGCKDDAGGDEVVLVINGLKQNNEAGKANADKLKEIEANLQARDAKDLLAPFLKANRIGPEGSADYLVCMREAIRDPEGTKKWLESRPSNPEPGRTTPPTGGATTASDREEELIANSVKEHKGDFADGVAALQIKLKKPYIEQGMTHKAANEACARAYPKIFAA